MPITWRLLRDHYGAPYSSDARWVAISGDMTIGTVGREVLTDYKGHWTWHTAYDLLHTSGRADTPEERKPRSNTRGLPG